MQGILIAAGVMGALGLLFGTLLAILDKKFFVPVDPVATSVRELLPGANCGACSFVGCDQYSEAVAKGEAAVNKCPVGGDGVAQKIGELMGVTAEAQVRKVAIVLCRGDSNRCKTRFEYDGKMTCKSAALAGSGDKDCVYSCLGLGDCQAACPFGAISVNEQRLAIVDEDKCRGCELCMDTCPRGILQMRPMSHAVHRQCSAMERGKLVREHCTAGCVGCGLCEKNCKFGALTMKDELPHIDLTKCVGCMRCADRCPTGALQARETQRKRAIIDLEHCVNCDMCAKACQFNAIIHNDEGKRAVLGWTCTGCGDCVSACKFDCIELVAGARFRH